MEEDEEAEEAAARAAFIRSLNEVVDDESRLSPPKRPGPDTPSWADPLDRLLGTLRGRGLRRPPREVVLTGAAGTGKTTLVRQVIESWDRGAPLLLAPTGKAARRLSEVVGVSASTIHSAIYPPPTIDPDTGEMLWAPEEDRMVGSSQSLVIVDEASMVNETIREHLLQAVHPLAQVLWVGDPHQLRPVEGELGPQLDNPDVHLTTIHRQAEGSPIIKLGQAILTARDWRELRSVLRSNQGHNAAGLFQLMSFDQGPMPADWGAAARKAQQEGTVPSGWDAQLICVNNGTRHALNHLIRGLLGRPDHMIVKGDRLVVLQNMRVLGVLNGQILPVDSVIVGGEVGAEDVPPYLWEIHPPNHSDAPPVFVDPHLFQKNRMAWMQTRRETSEWFEALYEAAAKARKAGRKPSLKESRWLWEQRVWEKSTASAGQDAARRRRWWGPGGRLAHVDFGEVLTCHKFQGSQAPAVGVVWSNVDDWMAVKHWDRARRWWYTAATRAEHALLVWLP